MFDPGIFPALSRAALQPGAQVRILPAGLFRPGDGRPLRAPGWYLDAAIAARLVAAGAADMMGPAMVVLLAGGVSVIMTNTQTLDTILNSMEQLVSGVSAGAFAVMTILINIPLAVLIPSSSGHGALAMPLLSPLADFAGVTRDTTITAWIMGHGLTLLFSPTSVVLVGGLAIAKVGYDKYLRFVWPLLLMLFATAAVVLAIAASLE